MQLRNKQRGAILSWLFIAALFTLCGILGVLQYRWIGEVSVADRERLQQSLQGDLNRIGEDLNSEISLAARALLPSAAPQPARLDTADLAQRYSQWRKTSRHAQLFSSVALAIPNAGELDFQLLEPQAGVFHAAEWPAEWKGLRDRFETRLQPDGWRRRGGPTPRTAIESHVFEIPVFGSHSPSRTPQPFGRREIAWLVLDLNLPYVRENLLPELVQRHLGGNRGLEYQVDILTRTEPPFLVYQSNPGPTEDVEKNADAAVALFDPQIEQFQHPEQNGGRTRFQAAASPRGMPGSGRWQMFARNRAGSLEAVVASTRRRNLAVTGGVLLLLMAAVAALVSFTRRAQKLAALQMDFVAGVSHELRTPLAVIHGAAYNLRGVLARNPLQVEKYGALLQQESSRLRDLVEQVLRFSSAEAGRVIQEKEPVEIETLIQQAVDSSKAQLHGTECQIQKELEPGLPIVLGDSVALKHALLNLLNNALKYGANQDGRWIGISAVKTGNQRNPSVEIRVTDRGPGIPKDEQAHVFDPFFRGKRALQDQIHGSGLGLNLVKKIIEAHGGCIRVESEPMKRTEFIVSLPATSQIQMAALAEVTP